MRININYIYIFLYIIANILILFNYDGLYWDDWVAYNQEPQTLAVFFGMIQHGIKGEFYLILSNIFNQIYPFRLFIFFAYFLIGYFIYRILWSTGVFSQDISKLIGFTAVIIPINAVNIYISIAPFVFPLLIFYFSFYLLVNNYPFPNRSLKVIVLFLFLCSFSTNSILVFYGMVLLYLFYMDNDKSLRLSFKYFYCFFKNRWDFISLPIFYFIYKSFFLMPYGIYDGYNKVSFSLEQIQLLFTRVVETMTIDFVYYIFDNKVIVIISVIIALIISFISKINFEISKKKVAILFGLSIVTFFLAVFPYIVVGKTPVIEGNNGRFALLLAPALSMFFISLLALFSHLFFKYKGKAFVCFISLFIALFISKNISQQYEMLIDNYYKAAIIESFKKNKMIQKGSTFVVHPYKTRSFYEWNGLLKKAFGDTKRLMILPSMVKRLDSKGSTPKGKPLFYMHEFNFYKQYNFYQWNSDENAKLVFIKKSTEELSLLMQLRLFYHYLFNQNKFKQLVQGLVFVEVKQ